MQLGYLDGRMAWLNNGECRYGEAMAAAEQGRQLSRRPRSRDVVSRRVRGGGCAIRSDGQGKGCL